MAKTTRIKVTRGSRKTLIGRIVAAAHPEYTGRKVAIEIVPLGTPVVRDPADGGTFARLALVSLESTIAATQIDPTRAQAVYGPEVFGLLVAWDHHCGLDCGITIYLPEGEAFATAVDAILEGRDLDATPMFVELGTGATRALCVTAAYTRVETLRAGERSVVLA